MKVSVIIPVYNEAGTILEVVRRVRENGVPIHQIVIVNDCSKDGTAESLKALEGDDGITILHHQVNQGKGAAIRTGQGAVTGDIVIIQDADFEYNPKEYARLIRPIVEDEADVVYGSRYSGNEILVDTFVHYYGNKFLTTLSNLCSNLHLTDMETCYKVFRADLFKSITIESNRFGIEPEVTAKIAKMRVRIYEIPISYRARRYDEGKKIGWKDGVSAIWCIIKFNFLRGKPK